MRKALCSLVFSCVLAVAPAQAQTTINFNDGVNGSTIGNFYGPLGVTFTNARWDGFNSPDEAAVGAGGLKFIHTTVPYENKSNNPITATFSSLINSISVRGLNVGANGARIEAYDAFGILVGSAESFGIGAGVDNHPLLTILASDIKTVRFFQPASVTVEGMLWDNLSFASTANVVPEPSTYVLMATGMLGLVGVARRRRA